MESPERRTFAVGRINRTSARIVLMDDPARARAGAPSLGASVLRALALLSPEAPPARGGSTH